MSRERLDNYSSTMHNVDRDTYATISHPKSYHSPSKDIFSRVPTSVSDQLLFYLRASSLILEIVIWIIWQRIIILPFSDLISVSKIFIPDFEFGDVDE